jgi:hypothetical protein
VALLNFVNGLSGVDNLRRVLLEILTVCPTSCKAERGFSRAGLQFSERRRRTGSERLRELALLGDSLELLREVLGADSFDQEFIMNQLRLILEYSRQSVAVRDLLIASKKKHRKHRGDPHHARHDLDGGEASAPTSSD